MGKRLKGFNREVRKNWALFTMLIPATLVIFLLAYMPMTGLILAFKNYRFDKGIFGSDWNGLENFRYMFSSGTGWLITKNTVLYNLMNLITSQSLAILIAIFISEINNKIFKKVTQSIIFLPYFISWVIVGTFVYAIFNYEAGILNNIVTSMGKERINVYSMPGIWPVIIMLFNSWKWCGYNSVIYIAAITGVDAEIYEAATIDGATIFQRIWHINVPVLMPTVIILLILQVGSLLGVGYEKAFLLQNSTNLSASEIISTYVYKVGLEQADFSFGTAAGLFNSVVNTILLLATNWISKKVTDTGLF